MNRPIKRVFLLIVVLFALLVGYTVRWTIVEADDLNKNALNQRSTLRELRNPRGAILADQGAVLARSVRRGRGENAVYTRRYPQGDLYGRPVGYSFVQRGNSGLEKQYDDELAGRQDEFESAIDELLGRSQDEHTMITALDQTAQRVANQGLAGRAGAVVVIEPHTGRVPVYLSVPGYDPNLVRTRRGFESLNRDSDQPLFDRVSQAAYPPGSTFKIVTATAGLDSGVFTPESTINGDSPKKISGTPLANSGSKSYGNITFSTALVNSVNTAFAQVGEKVGSKTLISYMKKFGFYQPPPIDLPRDEVVSSGLRRRGHLLPTDAPIDIGRTSIGQERLTVTPLQMATVAATVANDGVRIAPRIARSFRDRYGRTTTTIKPKRIERVMSTQTASELNLMMRKVVEEGTGQPAQISGLSIAGKTGTAERGTTLNQAWFIGFAPAENPRFAIAVTIEETPGFGGTVAAPIARDVLKSLLR
jgi:peptidoglycan glycosyltransferase